MLSTDIQLYNIHSYPPAYSQTKRIKQFLKTQLITLKKKYWGKTIKEDLLDLGLEITIEEIELMLKQNYKKLIRKKVYEKALEYIITKRNNCNGKGMKLSY